MNLPVPLFGDTARGFCNLDARLFSERLQNWFPAMREVAGQFESFLADLVKEAVEKSSLPLTPEEMGRVLLLAVHGFKATAQNGADLRRLMALQVRLTVTALGCP